MQWIGEFWDPLGELWAPFGMPLGSFGEALGVPWDLLGEHAKNIPQRGHTKLSQRGAIVPKRVTVIISHVSPQSEIHFQTALSFGPAPALEG